MLNLMKNNWRTRIKVMLENMVLIEQQMKKLKKEKKKINK